MCRFHPYQGCALPLSYRGYPSKDAACSLIFRNCKRRNPPQNGVDPPHGICPNAAQIVAARAGLALGREGYGHLDNPVEPNGAQHFEIAIGANIRDPHYNLFQEVE